MVYVSPVAQEDIKRIKEYIACELHNISPSERISKAIFESIQSLRYFPEAGSPLSARLNITSNYRYIVCERYLIFYRFEMNSVYVDRVLYERMDYIRILFDDIL